MKLRIGLLPLWRLLPLLAVIALIVVALPSYDGTPTTLAAGNNGSTPSGVLTSSPVAQVAVTPNGPWQEFSFSTTALDANGCFPADPSGSACGPSSGGNSVVAGVPPWTFTAPPGGATLTVADAFCKGDRFSVKDFGVSIGTTSAVAVEAGCAGISDPDITSQDATFSSASFALAAGPHSITIRPTVSPFNGGAAYFRLTATCIEEPIDPSVVTATIFPGQSTDVGKCITLPPNPAFSASDAGAVATGTGSNSAPSAEGVSIQAAVPVGGSVWHGFTFTDTSTDATSCPGCTSFLPNVDDAGAPPWTFVAPAAGATLYVTDAFCIGDQFTIMDGGFPIGTTSVVTNEFPSCTSIPDPVAAWASGFSKGAFSLAPGAHSITIRPNATWSNEGSAWFIVQPNVTVSMVSTCTPPIATTFEPSSQTAPLGSQVVFTETISVAGTALGGTYECDDIVLVDGVPFISIPPFGAAGASALSDNGGSGGASIQTAVTVDGGWVPFDFTGIGIPASPGPWTFTAPAGGAVLLVTDDFCIGDAFDVSDSAAPIGSTNPVASEYPSCTSPGTPHPDVAWSTGFSHGFFLMAPGPHSIDIAPYASWDPSFGLGSGYLAVVTGVTEHKTITVPEGFLTGGGQINDSAKGKNQEKISFGGNVGFLADGGLLGHWNTIFHNVNATALDNAKFHSTSIDSLQFSADGGAGPNPPPANANVARFTATGRLKIGNGSWVTGYKLEVCLADRGEPGSSDSILFTLTNPGGTVVYRSYTSDNFGQPGVAGSCLTNKLDNGNLQIHSGLKS